MLNSKFEKMLANFCSPVLLGKKVSNLVSIIKSEIPDISIVLEQYNSQFNRYDLYFKNICECENRVLIFVYKKSLLEKHFLDKEVGRLLVEFGYSTDRTLEDNLSILEKRMINSAFPHEIGLFLGYPINDVMGFIDNKGQNYKYCGYWKVYKNVEKTKRIFKSYDNMKNIINKRLDCGECIENILIRTKNNLQIA